ncbi:MAG: hypothetical protein LBD30_08205 [Verrucomicrobiales bacterium]|jgi:hypothetical protein|nr:hypothetical protein [Verrucomicrobiales bacterium]
MKETHSIIALILGGLALLLTIVLVGVSIGNRSLERKIQAQQVVINNGQVSQQVGRAIINDAATLAVNANNAALRELLAKHGIQINQNQSGGK